MKHNLLLKISSFTALSTVVRMITSLVINKIIAVSIGVFGLVYIGQLSNIFIIALTFISGISIGLTKYISQYIKSESKLNSFINTAFTLIFIYSIIIGTILFFISDFLSFYLFKSINYSEIIIVLAFTFVFSALNVFLLAAINGFKQFKKFVTINIINSIITLVFTVLLIYLYNIKGALIASASYQSISFVATYIALRGNRDLKISKIRFLVNTLALRKLLFFSLMPIGSGIAFPAVQILIRNLIINDIDINSAGYWDALNRISNMFIMLITTSLSVYFLPRLSELKKNEINNEIRSALITVIPALIVISIFAILLRKYIILILFSSEFLPMSELFLFQFAGNIFKVAGWIIAYQMLAKAMIIDYFITEVLFYFIYILLTYALINKMGLQATVLSYAISYFVYFVYLILRFDIFNLNKYLIRKKV